MKKDFQILVFLTCIFTIIYFAVPNLHSNFSENIVIKDNIRTPQEEVIPDSNILTENVTLNFDIVRISKHGDAVMAGKSNPNLDLKLLDNNKVLSSLQTDSNGEWIWVSDMPLKKGIKKFRLMHIDNEGEKSYSDQTIIIFNNAEKKSKPKVIKFLQSNQKDINLLNVEPLMNGLSLDMVNYDSSGELFFSGRSSPNAEILILDSNEQLLDSSQSNDDGNWKFSSNISRLSSKDLIISSKLVGQDVQIIFTKEDLKKIINYGNIKIKDKEITIETGNSLWRIARKIFGGGIFYTQIYENNSKLIKDPNLIYPGQVFILPEINTQF